MKPIRSVVLALGSLLAVVLVVSGCGNKFPNQGTVTGQVTLDGQPIEQGSIRFTPIEGAKGAVAGGVIAKGRYELTGKAGPALGWNRVEIHAMRKSGKMVQKPFAAQGEMIEAQEEAVPASYNTASTLKVEIKSGANTADFAIVSK